MYTNEMKKYPEAAKLMKRALKLDPDDLDINFNLAEIYEKLNDVKGAIKHYTKAQTLDPNDEEIKKKLSELKSKKVDAKKPMKRKATNDDSTEDPPKKKDKDGHEMSVEEDDASIMKDSSKDPVDTSVSFEAGKEAVVGGDAGNSSSLENVDSPHTLNDSKQEE